MEQRQLFLSYPEVRKIKDAAIAQVSENAEEWITEAIAQLRATVSSFPPDFLAETIRERIVPLVGSPHSHKAWGALTARAIKERIIVPTGQFRTTRSKKTHGHKTAVYRAG